MAFSAEIIKEVWKRETEILDVIDGVCKKYGLRYSIAYGTLIGAVRHKGFIPWDDDVDIVMPREDYEKLIKIWYEAVPNGYILQNKHIYNDFTQNFTQIRKDHTTFLQHEVERKLNYHKGIYVDIFPGDRVAPGKVSRIIQYIACAVNLLYARGFTSGASGIMGAIEKILLKAPSKIKKYFYNKTEMFTRKWNDDNSLALFFPSTIDYVKHYLPANLFEDMTTISFEGKEYSCVKDYDGFLRSDYGDYMQLPPEEERTWYHHPIVIDFEHNYEEIKQ